jgi:hypothetical protein
VLFCLNFDETTRIHNSSCAYGMKQAGNTPLHNAAYEGWIDGAQTLLQLGAKVNASNNVRRPAHRMIIE